MISLKDDYEANGYVFGIRGIESEYADCLLAQFQDFCRISSTKGLIPEECIYKPHLVLRDFYSLTFNTKITEVIEEILGEDAVCWTSLIFKKNRGAHIGFHQDLKYWGFSNSECLTVSLALTESNENNGCLMVVPQSHQKSFEHQTGVDTKNNMLVYSQNIEVQKLQKKALVLDKGEFSVHHGDLVHGSFANNTDTPRVLLSIRFCKASNPSRIYRSAIWNSSKVYNHFEKEPKVEVDYDFEALAYREKILRNLTILHAQKKIGTWKLGVMKHIIGMLTVRRFYYFFMRFFYAKKTVS
ncbi:MAG: hypothetical protein CMD52_03050 [Gammaproteobacteria bacterium]|nr:hypothetical protein [Gammaproteobacteria bacterium]|tara:strand:- start:147 stop:1040 length:894 start_codon:yes stop_codon:yes gene_type:complete